MTLVEYLNHPTGHCEGVILITVVDELPFRVADDDPFLVRKLEEAYKTFEEAPVPDSILKRMREED
jgi:hypothetical protein